MGRAGAKESARTLPRKWIEEEWGVNGVIISRGAIIIDEEGVVYVVYDNNLHDYSCSQFSLKLSANLCTVVQ